MSARARGRAFKCYCGEEDLRLTHKGPDVHDGTHAYLVGECGGGVRLKFSGAAVASAEPVDDRAVKSAREVYEKKLARAPRNTYDETLGTLKDGARARLEWIEASLRQRSSDLVKAGLEIGALLVEAKQILGYRHFGLFLEHLKITRERAFTSMRIFEAANQTPQFLEQFQLLGQEKTALLMRLPAPRRIDIIENGVPIDGRRVPITEVQFRPLNRVIQSLVGKSTRGRKPKPKPAAESREHYGLPAEIGEAIGSAVTGVGALRALVKKRRLGELDDKQRLALGRLWTSVWLQVGELDDAELGDLRHEAARGGR